MKEDLAGAEHRFCIIVGAGMSGVAVGAHIVKWNVLPRSDFLIVDMQDDYGGVWNQNKYPGLACDVAAHCYSMRFHLNPNWSEKYASREEIQRYYRNMAAYYHLEGSTKFRTKVTCARWNEEKLLWYVTTETDGVEKVYVTNMLVNGSGQFTRPKYADIPGKELFQGMQWHTSRWETDACDLTGKRVAMIGTGPSTAQIAPKIQPVVKALYLYQRSPTYCMPRRDQPIPSNWIWWFNKFPPLLWCYHMYLYMGKEKSRFIWYNGTKQQAFAQSVALSHLRRQVADQVLLDKLTPRHDFGCKRPLVLDNYYPMFENSNVELITDKPTRITKDSIISKPTTQLPEKVIACDPLGSYEVENAAPDAREVEKKIDVLIWGTGFDMLHKGANFDLYGQNGVKLDDLWGEDPSAYLGITIHSFCNYATLFGPNTVSPWSNISTVFEAQAKYTVQLIQRVKTQCKKKPYAFMPKKDVQEEYDKWIQSNMGDMAVIGPHCSNYYTNTKGRITFVWPFTGYYLQWLLLWPRWKDFVEITA